MTPLEFIHHTMPIEALREPLSARDVSLQHMVINTLLKRYNLDSRDISVWTGIPREYIKQVINEKPSRNLYVGSGLGQ